MTPGHRCPPVVVEATLLPWLLVALAPMNRTRVKELLRSGRVLVNGTSTTRHDCVVNVGDDVIIAKERPKPPDLAILYEDESLIAIDKPSGLLTVATESEKDETAFVRLASVLEKRGDGRPFVVHRLDRGTSGVLLFARSAEDREAIQRGWDSVEKTYLAIAEGTPKPPEGRIENFLIEGGNLRVRTVSTPSNGAKRAVSRYRVLRSRSSLSLIEVAIETGRKHQIRVHLAGLGCPIIGDADYGAQTDPARRLGLHAWKLALRHPRHGGRIELEAKLPEELQRIMS